jgi:uncharacterized BrkB/YihY/UPF0761 family membrane protein
MNQDIVPADKDLRRKFLFFLIFSVIAILFAAPYFNDYMQQIKQISKENPDLAARKAMFLLKISLGFVFLTLVTTGIYSVIIARKVLKSGQYPPPGMRVIRDTKLRTGRQAKIAAISLITLSCVLVISALFFLCWPYAFEKTILKKKSSHERMSTFLGKEVKRNEGFENSNAFRNLFKSHLLFSHRSRKRGKGEGPL